MLSESTGPAEEIDARLGQILPPRMTHSKVAAKLPGQNETLKDEGGEGGACEDLVWEVGEKRDRGRSPRTCWMEFKQEQRIKMISVAGESVQDLEMARQIRALGSTPGHLTLIPGNNTVEGED